MQTVQTATGTVSLDALGRTLIHEHVHVGVPGWQFDLKNPMKAA